MDAVPWEVESMNAPLPGPVGTSAGDLLWMRLAIEEAQAAGAAGEVPVGAVLVTGDRILSRGRNRREELADPTWHAELEALRTGAEALGAWRLTGCTLYVTLEPCPMCMGALVNARVDRVVWGAADPKAGAAETLYQLGDDDRLNHRVVSTGHVLETECGDLLREFFRELRARRRSSKDTITER
jgi:tRNA(adenine34) deaminase